MSKIALRMFVGSLLALGLLAAPAHAQSIRTFVSGNGTNAGSCSTSAPCRTFAYAITQTSAGGEILAIDSAGYGAVRIDKAISIDAAPGVEAAVSATSVNAIEVNLSNTTDVVVLRGLTLNGLNAATNGILVSGGGHLEVSDCVVRNFSKGVNIEPTATSQFHIVNTLIADNTSTGFLVQPASNTVVSGFLDRVTLLHNDDGFVADGDNSSGSEIDVTITDSIATQNTGNGFTAQGTASGALILARNTTASSNDGGFVTSGAGIMGLDHCAAFKNKTGVSVGSGLAEIDTYSNNTIYFNKVSGTLTSVPSL